MKLCTRVRFALFALLAVGGLTFGPSFLPTQVPSVIQQHAPAIVTQQLESVLELGVAEAGSLSDYLENKLLDHVFENTAYTPPATVYLGLSTADPLDSGAGLAAPTYTGYARKAITFAAAANRAVAQTGDVTFDPCTAGSSTVTHWALFDASSGGNMLAHGALSASKSIVAGNTPSVASGQVTITINAGYVSNYLANKLLDFAFRNQAFTQPAVHVALTTATVSDASTCATITEAGSGSYARVRHSGWAAASAGTLSNDATITFPTPTGSWGTITSTALCDSATIGAGNLLFYDNGVTDQAIGTGDTVRFSSSAFAVSLN